MTEAEWLAATDPTPMIGFIRAKVGDRKLRLLAVAACRRVWGLMKDDRSRKGIIAAELFADGQISEEQLDDALGESCAATYDAEGRIGQSKSTRAQCQLTKAVDSLTQPATSNGVPYDGWNSLAMIARAMAILHPKTAVERCPYPEGDLIFESGETFKEPLSLEEQTTQSVLIRDIFGNPFRPVAVDPTWRTSTVLALAQQMYDSRDFTTMPVLADALQDAGCEQADILNHCRGDGTHVRGCWVVDLILGKE